MVIKIKYMRNRLLIFLSFLVFFSCKETSQKVKTEEKSKQI